MNGYIKRSTYLAAMLLGWLVLSLPVQGASFDCAKAQAKVERLICADAELSKLDEKLSTAYKTAIQDEKQVGTIPQSLKQTINKANDEQKQRLVTEQKHWLKDTRNLCTDEHCVKQAYQSRLAALAASSEVGPASLAKEPADAFCAEIKRKMHTVESQTKGAQQTFYISALDKYYLAGEGNSVEKFNNLDIDGDGLNDFAEKSCSASTILPSDPCLLSVMLSSGKKFNFEGWDIRLMKYRSKIYVIAHHDDEARYKLYTESPRNEGVIFHPEVAAAIKYELYLLNDSGTTLICKNL